MTQVTSLSLSKELWEKGLRIKTEWYRSPSIDHPVRALSKFEPLRDWIPAPSTDELLAVMPPVTMNKVVPNFYNVKYSNGVVDNFEEDKSLHEVLGKMCLWMLENGYQYNDETKCLVKE